MGKVVTERDFNRVLEENDLISLSKFTGIAQAFTGDLIKYKVKCLSCGTEFWTDLRDNRPKVCPYCHAHEYRSQRERQIVVWLRKKGLNVVVSDRTILNGYEIDVFIPDYNIGLEFNGHAYHFTDTNVKNPLTSPKEKDYHLKKTLLALSKGVYLYHLWDWESLETCKLVIESALRGEPLLTTKVDINPSLAVYNPELKPCYYVTKDSGIYHQGVYMQKPLIWDSSTPVYEIYTSGFVINQK